MRAFLQKLKLYRLYASVLAIILVLAIPLLKLVVDISDFLAATIIGAIVSIALGFALIKNPKKPDGGT